MNQAQADLNATLDTLAELDSRIKSVIDEFGYPAPRQRAHGFATMLQIIVSQQLSTKVAAAIWNRVENLLEGTVSTQAVLSMDEQKLRDCGLSWQKVSYAKALAERIDSGELSPKALINMSTSEAIKTLTEIKGYGIWSAEIYVMFALNRPDVFPAGDLALQVAIQRLDNLSERPKEQDTREIAQRWSPHQSAAALLMWHYYGSTTLS